MRAAGDTPAAAAFEWALQFRLWRAAPDQVS